MIENRYSLLEVEGNDNQPQGNKRKKKQESTPNQITPAQRAKLNERKKKQKTTEQPSTKRQADPNEKFTPVGSSREDKEKVKGPKKLTREEFERERKTNPDSPILRGVPDEDDTIKPKTDDGTFEFRTRGGKTRNRGRIQDTEKEEVQRSPNANSPNRPNRGQGGNKFQGGRNQGGRNQGGKNQGGRNQEGRNQGEGRFQGKNQGGKTQEGRTQEGRTQGGRNQGEGRYQQKNQGGKTQGGYRGNENRPKKYQGGGTPAAGDAQRKKKYVSEPPVHGRPDERKPRSDVDPHKGGRGGNTSWGDDVKEQKKAAEEEVNNEDLSDSEKKKKKVLVQNLRNPNTFSLPKKMKKEMKKLE